MRARNKKTGSPIVKLFEKYIATSRLDADLFARNEDGTLYSESNGDGAEVDWSLGEPWVDDDDQIQYMDANHDIVPESDIEVYEEGDDATTTAPRTGPLTRDEYLTLERAEQLLHALEGGDYSAAASALTDVLFEHCTECAARMDGDGNDGLCGNCADATTAACASPTETTPRAIQIGGQYRLSDRALPQRPPSYRDHAGQIVTVMVELGDDQRDLEEVGRMFRIRAADGWVGSAFIEELKALYYVNEYRIDKRSGGPEEGGWWYDIGWFITCHGEHETQEAAAAQHDGLAAHVAACNEGLHPPSSVASEGRWTAIYVEDGPGADFPAERPHYG